MSDRTFGYIRVSTKEQNEERQVIALLEAGVSAEHIYIEKQSGKDFERPIFINLTKKLKVGDTLIVKSIDRLGRNYKEVIKYWQFITNEKKVNIVVLDQPLLDTRQNKNLIETFISDLAKIFFGCDQKQCIKYVNAHGAQKRRYCKHHKMPRKYPA